MSVIPNLTVYYGCMFSGKTKALIKHIQTSNLKNNELIVLKPEIDIRYSKTKIATHDGMSHDCILYNTDFDVFDYVNQYTKALFIDEAQFIDKTFLFQIKRLLSKGIQVVASGLDKDYLGRPFGLMANLIEMAEQKHHLMASCVQCGKDAEYSYRKIDNKVLILLGQTEHYEARCVDCFQK
jgi:thymidine kinase